MTQRTEEITNWIGTTEEAGAAASATAATAASINVTARAQNAAGSAAARTEVSGGGGGDDEDDVAGSDREADLLYMFLERRRLYSQEAAAVSKALRAARRSLAYLRASNDHLAYINISDLQSIPEFKNTVILPVAGPPDMTVRTNTSNTQAHIKTRSGEIEVHICPNEPSSHPPLPPPQLPADPGCKQAECDPFLPQWTADPGCEQPECDPVMSLASSGSQIALSLPPQETEISDSEFYYFEENIGKLFDFR